MSRLYRALRWGALALVFILWAHALWTQRDAFYQYTWQVQWPPLLLAQGALLLQMLSLATAWWYLLVLLGGSVPWRVGASMWLRAQLARYVPGGVWDVAGRAWIGREMGLPGHLVPAGAVLEMSFQVLSAAFFLLSVLFLLPQNPWRPFVPLIGAGMLLIGAFLWPPLFRRALLWAARRLHRPIAVPPPLPFSGLLRVLGLYLLAHALQGVGFVLFLRGISPVPTPHVPLLVGAYVAAWLVGYVAVFTPTGIGVREGALVLLLRGVLSMPVVTAAALGYRVWLSLRDGLAAGVGILLARRD